jgi:hypothetical protein
MMRKYPLLKYERYLINELRKGIISYLRVYVDASLDVDEKSIIFRSVTF